MKRIILAACTLIALVAYLGALAFGAAMLNAGDGAPPKGLAINLVTLAPVALLALIFVGTLPFVAGRWLKLTAIASLVLGVPLLGDILCSDLFVVGVPLLAVFGLWLVVLRDRLHLGSHPVLADSVVIPCGILFLIGVFCAIYGIFYYRSMKLVADAWIMWEIAAVFLLASIVLFTVLGKVRPALPPQQSSSSRETKPNQPSQPTPRRG